MIESDVSDWFFKSRLQCDWLKLKATQPKNIFGCRDFQTYHSQKFFLAVEVSRDQEKWLWKPKFLNWLQNLSGPDRKIFTNRFRNSQSAHRSNDLESYHRKFYFPQSKFYHTQFHEFSVQLLDSSLCLCLVPGVVRFSFRVQYDAKMDNFHRLGWIHILFWPLDVYIRQWSSQEGFHIQSYRWKIRQLMAPI